MSETGMNRTVILVGIMKKARGHSVTLDDAIKSITAYSDDSLRQTMRRIIRRMVEADLIYPIKWPHVGRAKSDLTAEEKLIVITLTQKGIDFSKDIEEQEIKKDEIPIKENSAQKYFSEDVRVKNVPVRQPEFLGGSNNKGPVIRAGALDFVKLPSKGF